MYFIVFSLVLAFSLLDTGTEVCAVIKRNRLRNLPQIIGGSDSNEIVPYHVYMECNGRYFCGGSLISAIHVLTAAHCIKFAQEEECVVKVVAGTNSMNNGGLYIMADKFLMNPGYSDDTKEHDVGVIKLKYQFPLSEKIMPINLTPYPPQNNEQITVTGYGRIHRNQKKTSETLKSYKSGLLRYESCYYRAGDTVHPTDICDYGEMNIGSCEGDSGSPVVNRYYLVGVVSRGIVAMEEDNNQVPDCANGMPNIFASVYYHLDFIKACLSV